MQMNLLNQNVAGTVFVTKNLDIFQKLKGNRNLTSNQLKNLEKSILSNNLLLANPILVNSDMEVIDGQTRLEIARKHNLEISYLIAGDLNITDAQSLNSAVSAWKPIDHLNSKVSSEDPEYKAFWSFIKNYPEFKVEKTLNAWLSATNKFVCSNQAVYKRKYVFDSFTAIELASFLSFLMANSKAFPYPSTLLIKCFIILLKNSEFQVKVLEHKIKTFPFLLQKCGTLADQMNNLLMIYNRNNRKPINIKGYKQY